MIVDYKPEQYFSLTPNQPAVIIHDRFSWNEQAAYGYHSEQIELISFSTLQLENDIPTLSVSQVSSPTIIVERAGSYAWTHKNWRVREEFVHTVAAAVGLFASTELPLQRVLLSPVCKDDFIFVIKSFSL